MRTAITLRYGRAPKGTYAAGAEYVRECRARLGLSQTGLAPLLCRSVEALQGYESGRARVPATVTQRLVELVVWKESGVAPDWATPFGSG